MSNISTQSDTPEYNKVLSTGSSKCATGKLHNDALERNLYLHRYIHWNMWLQLNLHWTPTCE